MAKPHHAADGAVPAKASMISFYRQYASRCEAAARNAPNPKMRAELSKMIPVWREFAPEHEEMLREGRNPKVRRNDALKGWM